MHTTEAEIETLHAGTFTVGLTDISHTVAGFEYQVVFVTSSDEYGDEVSLSESHLTEYDHASIAIELGGIPDEEFYNDYS